MTNEQMLMANYIMRVVFSLLFIATIALPLSQHGGFHNPLVTGLSATIYLYSIVKTSNILM